MKTIATLMFCAVLTAGTAFAQDKPATPAPADSKPASTSTPSEVKKPAAAKDGKDAAATKDASAAKDQPSAADASKPAKDSSATPQRFIPSEQVRSDFDVSFPVDI